MKHFLELGMTLQVPQSPFPTKDLSFLRSAKFSEATKQKNLEKHGKESRKAWKTKHQLQPREKCRDIDWEDLTYVRNSPAWFRWFLCGHSVPYGEDEGTSPAGLSLRDRYIDPPAQKDRGGFPPDNTPEVLPQPLLESQRLRSGKWFRFLYFFKVKDALAERQAAELMSQSHSWWRIVLRLLTFRLLFL